MSGLVSLVGAGPEAGLITLRGARRLSECEAVVYDELIPPELLRLAPEGAERINMGKRAGAPSARQEDICARLIALAREGKRVVRLKGGDAFVFGRGGEEAQAFYEWYGYRQALPVIAAIKDTAIDRLHFDHAYAGLYEDGDLDGLAELAVNKTVDLLLGGMKGMVNAQRLESCLAHMRKGSGR